MPRKEDVEPGRLDPRAALAQAIRKLCESRAIGPTVLGRHAHGGDPVRLKGVHYRIGQALLDGTGRPDVVQVAGVADALGVVIMFLPGGRVEVVNPRI